MSERVRERVCDSDSYRRCERATGKTMNQNLRNSHFLVNFDEARMSTERPFLIGSKSTMLDVTMTHTLHIFAICSST